MAKTVEYDGRSWCHQQFYGLVRRLVADGMAVEFYSSRCEIVRSGPIAKGFIGVGKTPWLALCETVEKMEES